MEVAVSDDPEYQKLNHQIAEDLEILEKNLSKEQMDMVNQLHIHINNLNCYECEAKFKYGLTMGLQLMQEAYSNKSSCKVK